MRIGIAQLNSTVGDIEGNLALAIDAYEQLVGRGVDLIVYPELFLCGYPPRDLLMKENFLLDLSESLNSFASVTGPTPALIGYAEKSTDSPKFSCYNAAAWCVKGKISQTFHKRLLPTYDVFDETRYFIPGQKEFFTQLKGKNIAVTICEDIWNFNNDFYDQDPIEEISKSHTDLLINLSASPWCIGKENVRNEILKKAAKKCDCPVVYVNAIGGNDELIFDGLSMTFNKNGDLHAVSNSFSESIDIHDLEDISHQFFSFESKIESLRKALVLGLRDYAHKSGFQKALLGLSGGIDSAVTASLAVEAFGADNVLGISLPSAISSQHSQDDAKELAKNLDIEFHTIEINNVVNSTSSALQPLFQNLSFDVTEENIQARSRGLILMAISNKFGALLLTTGNKSELAVGYCTLYGDMCGGLAVISDVPKMQVFALARHLNADKIRIPINTIEKPPSAELRPDQKDSDSLPDYETLDSILLSYVEKGKSIHSIINEGFSEETVRKIVRLVDLNEYKRNQAAPGLKISPLAFGVGRRMPIVQKYKN
ncbi:MAG: NAD+ synthase [Opitutae bacterium]|nr:NAD+ synthase [Opitutae bacterium]